MPAPARRRRIPAHAGDGSRRATADFAVFRIGATLLALPVDAVVEAVATQGARFDQSADDVVLGVLDVPTEEGRPQVIGVLDGRTLIGRQRSAQLDNGVVILVRILVPRPVRSSGFGSTSCLWVGEYDAAWVHVAAPVIRPMQGRPMRCRHT